eukprot:NODE_11664_length_1272_cov_8.809607.p2 GENE.NODE_11664_length_1272_cov_8.809607~~NODE_11664_length_1272_cov_8.809607.p2  ORF type:complete len:319 (-),score=49.80 NODE_11664_length_1272_cov_8.809607:263-1219(-)
MADAVDPRYRLITTHHADEVKMPIASVLQNARTRSSWWLYSNEHRLFEESRIFAEVARKVAWRVQSMSHKPLGHQLEALFCLEESLTAREGLQTALMRVLEACVDDALQHSPGVTEMERFAEALNSLQEMHFGSEQMTLREWGQTDCGMRSLDVNKLELARIERPELRGFVVVKVTDIRKAFSEYRVLTWFLGCLLSLTVKDKLSWLESPVFDLLAEESRKKRVLPWTTIGWASGILVNSGKAEAWHFSAGPVTEPVFRKISTVVLPQFVFDLSELSAVIDSQMKEVDNIRNRILAIGVTMGVFLLQLLAREAFKYVF